MGHLRILLYGSTANLKNIIGIPGSQLLEKKEIQMYVKGFEIFFFLHILVILQYASSAHYGTNHRKFHCIDMHVNYFTSNLDT